MKNSFVLYTDYMEQMELLTMEQRGILLTALFAYQSGADPPQMDGVTAMAFSFIKARIDKDNERYEKTCDARREAGKQGGRPTKAKKANGFFEKQTKAKKPDYDNDYDNDSDKDIKEKDKREKSGKPDPLPEYQYKEIIDYLNAKAGKRFEDKSKDTRRHINARIKEGRTLEDFKLVIDNMVTAWKDDAKMSAYLRPATLFGSSQHFENYMNALPHARKPQNRFADMPSRDYDMDEMERMLLGG